MTINDKDKLIQKSEFIDFISKVSPKEMNEFISSKGKPPKLIVPIEFLRKIELDK